MSKEILTTACNADNADNYVWSMCFYKIDRRAKGQPYKFKYLLSKPYKNMMGRIPKSLVIRLRLIMS